MQLIITIYALLFGLCFGSFANVLIYRLPRGESVVRPPSHCPKCGRRLAGVDLIPVLSWLLLCGRCRYCGDSVSRRYPAVEAACAALFAGMSLCTGASVSLIPLCMLAFVLLCVSFIDAETGEIPDGLLIFGAAAGVAWVVASNFIPLGAPGLLDAFLGACAGALPLLLIDRLAILLLRKDGFGYGDVKLMAMCGLFLGWRLTLCSLLFAVVAGGLYGAVLLLAKRAETGSYFAFGPFLAAGVLAALWFGRPFLDLLF